MKKIFNVILILVTLLTLLAPMVLADSASALMVDYADLLEQTEEAALREMLWEISESHQIEIAIVTTNSTDGKSIRDYADDFYDDYGYGWGDNDDGVMLVVNMESREYRITTYGLGQAYLDDDTLYEIEEAFLDDLSDGYYYDAFSAFANECDAYISYAVNGYYDSIDSVDNSNDFDNDLDNDFDYGYNDSDYDDSSSDTDIFPRIGISLIVGFIISLIIVSTMKGKMTTVRAARNAANYVVAGSLNLTSQSDRYLYSNTIRTPRNTGNSSGGSGGSVHRSSSGRSHGGRGGRF